LYETKKKRFNIKITNTPSQPREKKEQDCPICYEKMQTMITTNCNHEFCDSCVKSYLESCTKHPTCPLCREKTRELKTTNKKIQKMLDNYCSFEEPETQPERQPETQPVQNGSDGYFATIFHGVVGF
jgi:hypothetical protein